MQKVLLNGIYALLKNVVLNLIYVIMNFNMHQSVDKREYFLDSLITRKSLKLVNNILN